MRCNILVCPCATHESVASKVGILAVAPCSRGQEPGCSGHLLLLAFYAIRDEQGKVPRRPAPHTQYVSAGSWRGSRLECSPLPAH